MTETATRTALYVYGVVATPPPADASIAFVESGALAAITREVSLDEYGEEALTQNLNDRDWLEAKAREHEQTLQQVAAMVDVLPFRFGTICHTEDDVRALLDARRDALTSALARVRGRVEIGAKLWADRTRLAETSGSEPQSGRAYLEARRTAQLRKDEAEALCVEIAQATFERLLAHAVEGVANRPQPRELTGRSDDMLLNAAFLVEAGDTALLDEIARADGELQERGFSLEATGPWPPHNFADVSEDAE